MTPEQFCYWLQGRAELQPNNPPSVEEWKMIADHLKLVFKKETPIRSSSDTHSDLSGLSRLIKDAGRRAQEQGIVGSTAGIGMPQCGIGQVAQFGRNHPHIC